jgi:hypothetical protein
MWDEDPKYQKSSYRFLVWGVALVVVGGLVLTLWSGDWASYGQSLTWLAVGFAALCVYAALVWTIGHTIRRTLRWLKRRREPTPPSSPH